jgi:hypothetical protein
MVDVVECALDVGIDDPFLCPVSAGDGKDTFNGIMGAPTGSEPITGSLETRFPFWFKSVLDDCLERSISHNGDSKWAQFAVRFRYVHTFNWFRPPGSVGCQFLNQLHPLHWRFDHDFVHTRRFLPLVYLCHSPDTL